MSARTPLPTPSCPAWCDRDHGGFSAATGQVQVEHRARRGSFELVAAEVVDLTTGTARIEPAVVLTADDDHWSAETPAALAARLRAEAGPLLVLADLLDGGRVSSAKLAGPTPDPIPTYRGGVIVGHRWPDGSRVEFDDDGEPVDAR